MEKGGCSGTVGAREWNIKTMPSGSASKAVPSGRGGGADRFCMIPNGESAMWGYSFTIVPALHTKEVAPHVDGMMFNRPQGALQQHHLPRRPPACSADNGKEKKRDNNRTDRGSPGWQSPRTWIPLVSICSVLQRPPTRKSPLLAGVICSSSHFVRER